MRVQWLLAGLVTLLGACGGGADSTTGPMDPQGNSVTVGNNFFTPADLSVAKGTTVTWTWAAGAVEHNVTFDDGQHSATQSSGSFPRTFSAAGTYPYHCTSQGAAVLHGRVTVTAGAATGGPGGGGGGTGGGGYDY